MSHWALWPSGNDTFLTGDRGIDPFEDTRPMSDLSGIQQSPLTETSPACTMTIIVTLDWTFIIIRRLTTRAVSEYDQI